jgi:anti-anti-sigma regulatory factor
VSQNSPGDDQDGCCFSVQRRPDGLSILSARGPVDDAESSVFVGIVADEVAREPTQLVLELAHAESVGTAFIDALVDASVLAGETDTSFCLVLPPTAPVAKALAAADLIERFEIFTTVGQAWLRR